MAKKPYDVKPNHKAIRTYYEDLQRIRDQNVSHEGAVRAPFQNLLSGTAKKRKWTLVCELSRRVSGARVVPDGTIRDEFQVPRGYWEAKDTDDDLDTEIVRKIKKGYPTTNIIFEDTREAALFQNGQETVRADLTDATQLADLLNTFFGYRQPNIDRFEEAVEEFKTQVPDLAKGLVEKIAAAHKDNKRFIEAFNNFFSLCQASLNPNISRGAVDEMLVQHMLTERLIRTIFDNEDFTRRNAIAVEVEKVIDALASKAFSRHDFLKSLDRFYVAIEDAAQGLSDFSEKQHFLNTVYEQFFQGYSVKVADTHGIVYTPQPIVDFMCASVEDVLEKEFGKTLGSKDVHILDPCTGTGNFIVNLLRRVPKRDLKRMYREQFFANEVMLLPYYIAALNIEHAYYDLAGEYEPFAGLCFVDTLDMADHPQGQFAFMTEANTVRVERQKKTPITVILGNPPYNVGQINENDNNKNRKYEVIEETIRQTYAKDSKATNKNALSDAYVKFFRWAVDRLEGRDGIVCFVTNNGFLRGVAFDGFRKHMCQDFDTIYHFDFKGNARTAGERRRREGGNIFSDQIRCGVGITVLVKKPKPTQKHLRYHAVKDYWRAEKKQSYLRSFNMVSAVEWTALVPDKQHTWLVPGQADEFARFVPLGTRAGKSADVPDVKSLFKVYGRGVATCRDNVVYDFDRDALKQRVKDFIDAYNGEVDRWRRASDGANVDEFVRYDKVKWSEGLKGNLLRGRHANYSSGAARMSLYRPFVSQWLYFDPILNERRYQFPRIFPTLQTQGRNRAICVVAAASARAFHSLVVDVVPDLHLTGDSQCFSFYIYHEDGSNRRENFTDWALGQFREQYKDEKIGKWDIFYYVYGLLHHPGYREKYGECLRRELPRIPFAPDFRAFSRAGKELAHWHIHYEEVEPYELRWIEEKDRPLSYRVEDKMRLNKDKTALKVNPSLTLADIPPETFEYRLGNRSALEWVIDQYRVKTDKRSRITSDPNRPDDEQYIVRLVGQVARISLETVRIVNNLPDEFGG